MRVIFVTVSMAGGGAERVISILANQFAEKGIGVTIMMTAGDEVAYRLDSRISLAVIGGTSGGSLLKRLERIRKMRRVFRSQSDAIIISFGPDTSFFAVMAALFLRNKFIISERNDPAAWQHPRLRNLVYRRAVRLVFQTEAAARCFPRDLRNKGCVIGNPVSSSLPEVYRGERKKRIVSVGRLEPQKNHALLLEAFALLNKEEPSYTLHFYGDGSLRKDLENHADRLKIRKKVIFEGFQDNVWDKIKDGAIYVLSSDYEGISNALLEAMGLGLPVISTDCPIGGSAMCIRNGENGLLVPVKEKEALAQAMLKMVRDPEVAAGMGKKAADVRTIYSEETVAAQWLALCYAIGGSRL